MKLLRRILAGTDFSAGAGLAADRAAVVAKETGAALELFHATNLSGLDKLRRLVPGIPDDLEQQVIDAGREQLAGLGRKLNERLRIAAGTHVAFGDTFSQLEARAAELPADLVVLGAHGTSALPRLVVGSTAGRMAAGSRCPVLVVKSAPSGPYRNVLIPVDFSAQSLPALTTASAVAPGANLILMHAYGFPFEGKIRAARDIEAVLEPYLAAARKKVFEKMHELSDGAGLSPHSARLLACHGEALHQILEQERERKCDLIIMGRHGEAPLLEQVFLGSVTKQVLAQSRADVLVATGE